MNPPACPYLPPPAPTMSYRDLRSSSTLQSAERYRTALQYGHYLWLQKQPARAILALIRALNTPIREHPHDQSLQEYPLPYAAIGWICKYHLPAYGFLGNPRISFQHQADRLTGPQAEIRRARAWAMWLLICSLRPDLPADLNHHPLFPSKTQIIADLDRWGIAEESRTYLNAFDQLLNESH